MAVSFETRAERSIHVAFVQYALYVEGPPVLYIYIFSRKAADPEGCQFFWPPRHCLFVLLFRPSASQPASQRSRTAEVDVIMRHTFDMRIRHP
jgi:hypothetical protein